MTSPQAFTNLRRYVERRSKRETCELCGVAIAPEHRHLIEPGVRKLICACDACSLLFPGGPTKYKHVPRRILNLRNFQMTDGQWDNLMIPIGMAFFYRNSPNGKMVAFYPSPAGATESLLSLESWEDVARENPILNEMEPDVEALLVNRIGHSGGEHFLAPIDKCYELVGLIRTHWRGLSGGADAWREIGRFFDDLKDRATELSHA